MNITENFINDKTQTRQSATRRCGIINDYQCGYFCLVCVHFCIRFCYELVDNSEEHRVACEVRQWKAMILKNGPTWWAEQKRIIKKHRGQKGLDALMKAWRKTQ